VTTKGKAKLGAGGSRSRRSRSSSSASSFNRRPVVAQSAGLRGAHARSFQSANIWENGKVTEIGAIFGRNERKPRVRIHSPPPHSLHSFTTI